MHIPRARPHLHTLLFLSYTLLYSLCLLYSATAFRQTRAPTPTLSMFAQVNARSAAVSRRLGQMIQTQGSVASLSSLSAMPGSTMTMFSNRGLKSSAPFGSSSGNNDRYKYGMNIGGLRMCTTSGMDGVESSSSIASEEEEEEWKGEEEEDEEEEEESITLSEQSKQDIIAALDRKLSSALVAGSMEVDLDAEEGEEEVEEEYFFNEFNSLGLMDGLVRGLAMQKITDPTPVQRATIPRLLKQENIVMAASTGSGKTLAYLLPVIQMMMNQEAAGYRRLEKRPRALVLVPTRELAKQVLAAIKMLSHYSKISSCAVLGGEQYAKQKVALSRTVDIVVASPGRLMQHKTQGNVYLSQVTHVVIDEVDTMLMQGFGSDIRAILRSVMANKQRQAGEDESLSTMSSAHGMEVSPTRAPTQSLALPPQGGGMHLTMATATLTKAVRALLADVEGGEGGQSSSAAFNLQFNDPENKTPRKIDGTEERIKMGVVEVDGLHRSLPNVNHIFEDVKGVDKMALLGDILARHINREYRTLVFCNTVDSCRAVQYYMNDPSTYEGLLGPKKTPQEIAESVVGYHGDLNSRERSANVKKLQDGTAQFMVCTDIAARGLDIPEIGHIILFDFPMNPIDYIHRAGRCGRAGRKGIVTSIVGKRDQVLAGAIKGAIARQLPIDSLTSAKKDYDHKGKLANVVGRLTKEKAVEKERRKKELLGGSSMKYKSGSSSSSSRSSSNSHSGPSKSGLGPRGASKAGPRGKQEGVSRGNSRGASSSSDSRGSKGSKGGAGSWPSPGSSGKSSKGVYDSEVDSISKNSPDRKKKPKSGKASSSRR